MITRLPEQSDVAAAMQSRLAHLPLHRRLSARLSLQGKLVLCFMFLLLIALGGSYWLFLRETSQTMWRATAERTVSLAQTLAMAGAGPLESGDDREIQRICTAFVKNDDVVGVGFANPSGQLIFDICSDPDAHPQHLGLGVHFGPQDLLQAKRVRDAQFGNVATVTAPVLRFASTDPAAPGHKQATRLVGYVTLSLSNHDEELTLARIYNNLALVGCIVLLLSFPAIYFLVRRIFTPIRQLVGATQRIAQGDLDAAVAIDRLDLIGTLARSFNQMVQHVKQQREELADANRDLEDKILQRTAQLETANKRLSSEIAEKEDFLRAVSHDLNAPLRNIAGMATMLLMRNRDKFDADVIHRLERIQKNVEAETDLIAELLELSRIKTRRQRMEPVDVNTLIRDIEAVLENDLRSNQIELTIENELPVITCEKARLRQVFQNLIDNAIKYMGGGALRQIQIGCSVGHNETEFYVRDSGIGIDPEDISKVFHVFRRGKNTANLAIPGKGVGLASCKSIVETYNGSIWVESELGKGSTFWFTINGKFVPTSQSGVTNHPPVEPAAAA